MSIQNPKFNWEQLSELARNSPPQRREPRLGQLPSTQQRCSNYQASSLESF